MYANVETGMNFEDCLLCKCTEVFTLSTKLGPAFEEGRKKNILIGLCLVCAYLAIQARVLLHLTSRLLPLLLIVVTAFYPSAILFSLSASQE